MCGCLCALSPACSCRRQRFRTSGFTHPSLSYHGTVRGLAWLVPLCVRWRYLRSRSGRSLVGGLGCARRIAAARVVSTSAVPCVVTIVFVQRCMVSIQRRGVCVRLPGPSDPEARRTQKTFPSQKSGVPPPRRPRTTTDDDRRRRTDGRTDGRNRRTDGWTDRRRTDDDDRRRRTDGRTATDGRTDGRTDRRQTDDGRRRRTDRRRTDDYEVKAVDNQNGIPKTESQRRNPKVDFPR